MKTYLLQTFLFNLQANIRLSAKIGQLPDPAPGIRLMSHLVNCQDRWLMRLTDSEKAKTMSWWEPLYQVNKLSEAFTHSTQQWIEFIERHTESQLASEVFYIDAAGRKCAALLQDIALQLNYHSIHHRAQVQMLIREQGLNPDAIDYIASRHRVVEQNE